MKYRKKPVEVEAVQWTGSNVQEIHKFAGRAWKVQTLSDGKAIAIDTLSGWVVADRPKWWFIKMLGGLVISMNDIDFATTYEPVEDTNG